MVESKPKYPTMAAALVAAQKHAQAVSKTSKNSFMGYKYASAEALIEEARVALNEAGLAVIPVQWSVVPVTDVEGVRSKISVTYMLVHESGNSLTTVAETSILPEKGRPQDKAEATALTYNLGYYLRGLLLLPREEESQSVDSRDDRKFEPPLKQAVRVTSSPSNPVQSAPPPASTTQSKQWDFGGAPDLDLNVEDKIARALGWIESSTTLADLNAARTKIKALKVPDDAVIEAYRAKHVALKTGGAK